MKKALSKISTVLKLIIIVVLAILLCANTYTLIARTVFHNNGATVFGFSWAMVATGSMEPEIMPGDFVVNRKTSVYKPGDIITFKSGSSLVTHRIVAETDEGFITKGDANNVEDAMPVEKKDIVGKLILIIPILRKTVYYLSAPLGMTILVFFGIFLIELPHLLKRFKQ